MKLNFKSLICGVLIFSLSFMPTTLVEAGSSSSKEVRPKDSFVYYSSNKTLNNKLQAHINKIPDKVLYLIQSADYHIYIVKDPTKYYKGKVKGALSGLTKYTVRKIYICNNARYFRVAVAHEIGHAYDHTLGWEHTSDEFKKVYEAEKSKFVSTCGVENSYYRNNKAEYFAETFSMYIYDKKTLKKNTPKTYKYMQDLLAKPIDKEREDKLANWLIKEYPDKFKMLGEFTSSRDVINYYIAIHYLPNNIVSTLKKQGWKVNFVTKVDKDMLKDNPKSVGYYNTGKKRTYVASKVIASRANRANQTVQDVVVHEFIHAYDYEKKGISKKIYNPSGKDSDEVFAYSFTDWLFRRPVKTQHENFFKNIVK